MISWCTPTQTGQWFSRRVLGGWLLFIVVVGAVNEARAQEVQWRNDYNTARKEAVEKNRPLLLDFGTENCMWCKRLDASTLRDPAVVGLLIDKYIPLKIDAEREAQLAQALNIQSYPTIVLAAPDGKILNTIVGYKEAAEFHGILEAALAKVPAKAAETATVKDAPPAEEKPAVAVTPVAQDGMTRDYQEATRAAARSEYARALSLLKTLVEDGKDRPVQVKARQLLQDIEQQAAGRLARSKQLEDKGQTSEALAQLSELLRQFPGTQAAAEAGQMLTALAAKPDVKGSQRGRRARELLAQAREDYRTQQYLCCLDRCEVLAASYADLPEGNDAIQLAAEIKNNPEWMRQACEGLSERLGTLYLSLAETWMRKGQPQQAVVCLERIVQTFPGTRQADAAQIRLSYIKGQTTVQTDYKKP